MRNPRVKPAPAAVGIGLMAVLLGAAAGAQETADNESAYGTPTNAPLWEVGIFGGVGRLPEYRGSDEYKVYALPLPFLIYRGEIVRADREGVRGMFYKGERVETLVSLSGNPPVSGSNSAREGMSRLQPLLEAGPAVKFFIHRGPPSPSLFLEAAVRGVVSVDLGHRRVEYQGDRAVLNLNLSDYRPSVAPGWRFGMSAAVDFADRRYNSYFYDVAEDEATPDRRAFRSEGGYGGFSLSGYAARRLTRRLSWGLYARWDNVDGAVYEDSPLVKEKNNYVLGTALIWKIAESERRVRASWR